MNIEGDDTECDYSKVCSTLRQMMRDWSEEGAAERHCCYGPILEGLERLYPVGGEKGKREQVRVLVPGCGLGRLPWEIVRRGFSAQGNEFAFYMLFASNHILNSMRAPRSVKVFPFLHMSNNHVLASDQLRPVLIPDVSPMHVPDGVDFSMCAGDFVEVYDKEPQRFDVVATCFFVDTAHNIIEYIRTIHRCLKGDGYWINLGPLLYHYADLGDDHSVELALDEVLLVARQIGFEFLEKQVGVQSPYAQDPRSMMKTEFHSAFFVAQKKSVENDLL